MGLGERNELSGIAPLGSFLHTLGVVLISPWRIHVLGSNPFHWPVTVKYRGTTILCQKDKTVITFPNGQTVTVSGPESKIVSLEEERNQSEPRMAARAK